MRFDNSRLIDRLALPITRACNRACPECPARGQGHVGTDELKWAGKLIGKIGHVEVTGGEPTLHPEFAEISDHIHEWFDCPDFLLLTNGWVADHEDLWPSLLKWDRVYISWYTNDFAIRHKSDCNTTEVNRLEDWLKKEGKPVYVQRMDAHVPLGIGPRCDAKCRFGYDHNDMVAYYKGQIWGCCTAWQLGDPGRGIVLTESWRDDLGDIDLPCDKCFIGVAA